MTKEQLLQQIRGDKNDRFRVDLGKLSFDFEETDSGGIVLTFAKRGKLFDDSASFVDVVINPELRITI